MNELNWQKSAFSSHSKQMMLMFSHVNFVMYTTKILIVAKNVGEEEDGDADEKAHEMVCDKRW